jgi:XapX domain-containing protein
MAYQSLFGYVAGSHRHGYAAFLSPHRHQLFRIARIRRTYLKIALGLTLALAIGIACRLAAIPLPAPPVLIGALLLLAMTLGYVATDHFASHRKCKSKSLCGGPTGQPAEPQP